jgi:hypothetical protein
MSSPNAISGVIGSVAFASGFTSGNFAWELRTSGLLIENTGFAPTGGYRTRVGGNLGGWKGSYRCRQPVNATAEVSGPTYLAFPFEFSIEATSNVEDHECTPFGATWRTYVTANLLLDITGDYKVYVDDTNPAPAAEQTASAVFTIATGLSYSIPIITGEEITEGVAVDGKTPIITVPWKATGAPTIVGGLAGGATGSATFTAATGRTCAGTIVVAKAGIRCNRDASNSEWNVAFVGTGALTPA